MTLKEKIFKLREQGYSYNAIAEKLECSKSTISFHCNRNMQLSIKESGKKYYMKKYGKICTSCGAKFEATIRAKGVLCKTCFYKSLEENSLITESTYKEYMKGRTVLHSETIRKIKKFILQEQSCKCSICGISDIWNNRKLIFVLDHIDGNASNNCRENVRLICHNCDSQLDTYKSKNKNSARKSYRTVRKLELIIGNNNNVGNNIGEVLTGNADDNTEGITIVSP